MKGNPKITYYDDDPTHNAVWNLRIEEEDDAPPANLRAVLNAMPRWPICRSWPI
ncbi:MULTISPECIES: hypothetical protein [unclassified Azospirillum]|uniref:hypothetical protein n=1 Tax=unclassified Azospirillum TaxID=2630922 RepID=UPI001FFEB740|nr:MULTISPECIES: hypothetical protein [unclassified Azospirillum]